jgi:hypothetical protein
LRCGSSCGSTRPSILARSLSGLAASILTLKRRELVRDLDAILKAPTTCDLTRTLQAAMRQAPDQLLIFVAFSGLVDVTNNACERDLWPAVVQRKVTNGYRARWAAQGEVDVRTVVATAALQTKATPFVTLLATIIARSKLTQPARNDARCADATDKHLMDNYMSLTTLSTPTSVSPTMSSCLNQITML